MSNISEWAIYQKLDKQFKKEDIINALIDKHGYKEEDITDELVNTVLYYYEKGLSNDDTWNYILDNAIDSAEELLEERRR